MCIFWHNSESCDQKQRSQDTGKESLSKQYSTIQTINTVTVLKLQ